MTQVSEQVIRDFAAVVALIRLFEEIGVDIHQLYTDEEYRIIDKFTDTIPDNSGHYTEIIKRMFRESIERLLVEASKAEVNAE